MPGHGTSRQAHLDDAANRRRGPAYENDSAGATVAQYAVRGRVFGDLLAHHIAAAQRPPRQLPPPPVQPQQVEARAVLDVSLAIAIDLRVRAEYVTQHRGVAAHVPQEKQVPR